MPGSGKTTLGKKIANYFELEFIDSDNFIENKYHMSLQSLFSTIGEEGFRKIEHEALKEILPKENIVLSTGGGLPCFFDNMELLNNSGTSFYLKLNSGVIESRLINSRKQRPLTKGLQKQELTEYIIKTLSEREKFYKQAHYIIDILNTVPIEFISKIVSQI